MELSEAVEKAADDVTMPMLGMALTPAGPRFIETDFLGEDKYEYLQSVRPLMSKWALIAGTAVADRAEELGEFNEPNVSKPEQSEVSSELDIVFDTVGVDVACGIFALGYQLGDPVWDKQEHDRKTFHSALADRDTQKLLHYRFKNEAFLRERFQGLIHGGAEVMSSAFSKFNMPHTYENVKEWGRLSVTICYYEAFQVGLRARRIWEEDMTFDQIARSLED